MHEVVSTRFLPVYRARVDGHGQVFEPAAVSVSAARRYAAARAAELGREQLQDDVRTLVSELASNAVLHARTPFRVALLPRDSGLTLTVADGAATRPRLRRHGDDGSTTGRGLHIVAAVSARWGVTPAQDGTGGKVTWCELDEPTDEAPPADPTAEDLDALLVQLGEPDPGSR